MENRSFARPTASAIIDEGLRQYMMKVYNFMAGGLCVTALVAYLIANTSLQSLFFGPKGLTGLGWLAFLSPFLMVFGFGWVISRGTAAQTRLAFWIFSALMGDFNSLYRRKHYQDFPDFRSPVRRHEPLRLYDQKRSDIHRLVHDYGRLGNCHCCFG